MRHKQKHEITAAPGGEPPMSAFGERSLFLFAFVCLAAGIALGYILRGVTSPAMVAPAGQSTLSSEAPAPSSGSATEALEAALRADPKNANLLIQLGNSYYDHHDFGQAIAYYQRAIRVDPRDANVRTDLGTAYVYTGLPQEAVAQYQQALAIDPRHFKTLFNLGVVYETGLKDPARAIAAWQELLKLYPQSSDRTRVESLIQSAKRDEAAKRLAR